jgi:hypothetical protein
MSIWSKILIGLIAVAALPFFYLALRTLKTHQAWHGEVGKYEKAIADAEQLKPQLLNGTNESPGIRPLTTQLHATLVDRGRVWRDATPGQVNPQTGEVTITFAVPPVSPIDDKAVLFIFDQPAAPPAAAAETLEGALAAEEPAEGAPAVDVPPPSTEMGAYLGQFKVVGIGESGIALQPTSQLTPTALKRLTENKGPWSLAEVLRADRHDIFDPDNPAHLAMLPESVREEYQNDGKPAGPNVPPHQVVNGNFVRPLRDYDVWLREDARLRTIEVDQLEAAKKDLQYITAAHKDALVQEQSRRDQIAALETELAEYTRQRDAVVAHEQQVAAKLAEVQAGLERLFAENKRLAAELADLQSPKPEPAAADNSSGAALEQADLTRVRAR